MDDTIDLTAVDEPDRLDRDPDPAVDDEATALDGGDDAALDDVYADPGPLVEEDLG